MLRNETTAIYSTINKIKGGVRDRATRLLDLQTIVNKTLEGLDFRPTTSVNTSDTNHDAHQMWNNWYTNSFPQE